MNLDQTTVLLAPERLAVLLALGFFVGLAFE